jgi:hypothetical protein
MDGLFSLAGTFDRDPRIESWFAVADPHRLLVRPWFERMRTCGEDVREVLHDGCPTACVGVVPFAYVAAFSTHANVGFFRGAELPDPAGLLAGSGRRMRHVKLRPGRPLDEVALDDLIRAAWEDIRRRLASPGALPLPPR